MVFNADKCKVVHFGHGNKNFSYEMIGVMLEFVEEECYLGVIVQNSLKIDKECTKAVKSTSNGLGMIRRSFINKH